MSKSTKSESNGKAPRARKDGLRTAQVRILKALLKKPLTKAGINSAVAKEFPTAAKFSQWMADPLGSLDKEVSKAAEARCGYKSLLSLGAVKHVLVENGDDGIKEHHYEITDKGRKLLKEAQAK